MPHSAVGRMRHLRAIYQIALPCSSFLCSLGANALAKAIDQGAGQPPPARCGVTATHATHAPARPRHQREHRGGEARQFRAAQSPGHHRVRRHDGQASAAATAAAVPLAVPLVVMKMRRASAVALLVMKGAACRLPSLGIERRRRRRRLLCGGRRFAAPTLPTNARRRRTRLPRARSALAIGVHLSRTG